MTEICNNCGETITAGSIIKSANARYSDATVTFINLAIDSTFSELCQSCGQEHFVMAVTATKRCQRDLKNSIGDFPMMTVQYLPPDIRYRFKGMLTANVTVGTGIFNEFSQGFSDFFGMTNTQSGMAYKINSGEAVARGILVNRALAAGANCVIGVDIDYGVTATNAATVNMQGTGILVENLADLLGDAEHEKALELNASFVRLSALTDAWTRAYPNTPLDQ